jgi:putative membrane protein
MTGWSAEPWPAGLLLLSVTLYVAGLIRMGPARRAAIAPPRRVAAYVGAAFLLVLALFSPIDRRADDSFAWHMAQHLILMLGAGPLLAVANTHLVSLCALPLGARRRVGRAVNRTPGVRPGASSRVAPLIAALAFTLGLWIWHAPGLYGAALESPPLHTLEHLTFLATSAIFWRMVATSGQRRLDPGSAILIVSIVGLQGNLMAVLILLAPDPIYSRYAANTLGDQQIAAMLMLVPASLLYLSASIGALIKLLPLKLRPS